MALLPFLKNKRPRVAPGPQDEKLVNASPEDHVAEYCIQELMDAVPKKDIKKFRDAVEALVMNMFEWDEEHDA